MKNLITALAVLIASCSAPASTEPAPDACPATVECGWSTEHTCPAETNDFTHESTREDIDGGVSCWFYVATCVPKGTRPDCIPDKCRENPFTTCVASPVGGTK